MASQTTYYNLNKPAYNDAADIAVINGNMDTIDTTLHSQEQAIGKILPVISGSTNNSGYAISAGEYFEANGALYQATASIPTGNAWSSSATALSDHGAINALNSKIDKLEKGEGYLVTNTDLNTLTATGQYRIYTGCTNTPTNSTEGILIVENCLNVANSFISQRMIMSGSGNEYKRLYSYGTWSTWVSLSDHIANDVEWYVVRDTTTSDPVQVIKNKFSEIRQKGLFQPFKIETSVFSYGCYPMNYQEQYSAFLIIGYGNNGYIELLANYVGNWTEINLLA